MAAKIELRFAREGDAELLLANMRQADYNEVMAAVGEVENTVHESIVCSNWTIAATADGELLCLFGLAPIDGLLGRRAAPWLLGTNLLDRYPGALMKHCRRYVAGMLHTYPHLLNFVDARNRRSIRWLRELGFTIHPAVPYGPQQLPFHLFEMKA